MRPIPRTLFFPTALLITLACLTTIGLGQEATKPSLAEQLLAEPSASLAAAARQRGDAVRGAILFAQKSLDCATCHSQGSADRIGPDLTRVNANQDDTHFVDAILRPSKTISKGYETTKILTDDGRLLSGRIVRESADQIVLREITGNQNLVNLDKQVVEHRQADAVSAMPDKLADQLNDKQQFLDLVRYVMEIAGTGLVQQPSDSARSTTESLLDPRLNGIALMDQHGCGNCHGGGLQSLLPPKQGPSLTEAAARIDPQYLERFIANPHVVKPGTSMPDAIAQLDQPTRAQAAKAITRYLVSVASQPFQRQALDAGTAERGRTLFQEIGCVACHSPRDDTGKETLAESSVALGDLRHKYNLDGLSAFLENPHSIRPSGRMPNLKLTHWEAIDLANYLLAGSDTSPTAVAATPADRAADEQEWIAKGRDHFARLGCIRCHEVDHRRVGVTAATAEAASRSYPPLANLDTSHGCLSAADGPWPKYELEEHERTAIRKAIGDAGEPVRDSQQIELTMQTLRCYSCHRRGEIGGITDDRDLFFHTTNENLGPQGRLPPNLTGVGGKLKSKWLRQVLVSGRAIRPYMKTRMPQYGSENVGHLVDLFAAVDPKPLAEIAEVSDAKEARTIGAELVGNTGLNCIACHTFQYQPAQTMPAVDLTEMAERLHPAWFQQYMLAPQVLNPGTVMPSFWPGGKAIRTEIADGDTDRQIAALWEYLLEGRQARTPRGQRREPIELVASDGHAVMLRRSYPGIGKRGIGVGYPGQVNLAFDAEQMRLAMIWKGKFADPGGVWYSQGHGNVRPLGEPIRFATGPDLDDADSPWIVDTGRPPNHQFTGYFLDDAGRPTFMYRFEDVAVEDGAIDFRQDDSSPFMLRRTLKFTTSQLRPGLTFRVASGAKITKADDHTFVVDGNLRVQIPGDMPATIVRSESEQRLVIPLDLRQGSTNLVLQYTW